MQCSNVSGSTCARNESCVLEGAGEAVINSVLAGGLTPRAPELQAIYQTTQTMKPAIDWLTERGDFNGAAGHLSAWMRSAGTSTSVTPRKENRSFTRYLCGCSEVCFTM